MALQQKRISFLRHIFISPSYFSALFSTLEQNNNITPLRSPFADFAASRFNLSSADIARMLKHAPSLDKPKTLQNAEQVVHLLIKYGCSDHHIAHIMRYRPKLLLISAEKLLEPKIELLRDLGTEKKDLPELLFKVPEVLNVSLQNGLLPKITFLKSFFQPPCLFLKAVKLNPRILTSSLEKTLRPSLAFWQGCGFQRGELARFLSSKPSLLLKPSLTPPKADLVRKIGICKESNQYKYVMRVVFPARMETLESKIDLLRDWGLSAEEIWELFRISPTVFNISNDTLRKKMEFVERTAELRPNSVVNHSVLLRCSLENVLKPRFAVFQHMKSLNGVEHLKSKQLQTVLSMSKVDFVNKILKQHPELEALYALHEKAIPNVRNNFQRKLIL